MKICPNLSDPAVKNSWDAIANDPELGRAEAMREFMEAEKQDREIGTPAQVKEKFKLRFHPKSDVEQAQVTREMQEKIMEKSNDPVYDDPNTLMGIAILSSNINGKNLSVGANSQTRAMEIAGKLSQQIGLPFAFITPEEAVRITANTKNPYDAKKSPAFFYGDTVYFIADRMTTELAFHEFAHPIIRAIQKQNPVLFDKMFEAALKEDRTLLTEAFNEYADLRESVNNETDPLRKDQLEEKYKKMVAEEVLVKALTRAAMLKEQNKPQSEGFAKLIKDIIYAVKQVLRKLFGMKINLNELDENTTMDQLAEMLVEGGNFQINTENVSEKDVVAYFEANARYINDLKNIHDKVGNQKIHAMTQRVYEGASQQIRMMMKNKNYAEILHIFADEYNRGDLQEMKSNLSKYVNELDAKADALATDIDRTTNEIQALVNSMMRLEVVMQKMEKHLDELNEELKKEPGNQDTVRKAYYYSHVLSYWQKYIVEVKETMREGKADTKGPMTELVNSIGETMHRSAITITNMNKHGMSEVLWDQWRDMAEQAEILFNEQIASLIKKGASKDMINRRYVEFHGMPKELLDKFEELKKMKADGTLKTFEDIEMLESLEKKSQNGLNMTKNKIENALIGVGKDAHWANSYLEGYLYNTDPVIGGFAMFYKNNMAEMEGRAQARYNEITHELAPLLKDVSFLKIGELGKKIGFVDNIGYFDSKKNEFIKKKVWTLLNPYKDYRHDIDKFNHDLRELEKRYNKTGSDEDKKLLADKLAEKRKHLKNYFHQEFLEEYYEKDALLDKDEIGREAAFKKNQIFEKMNDITHPLTTEYDILKSADQLDALWKEYTFLHSLYYPNGQKKTNSYKDATGKDVITNDLAIAERLQEHREFTRKFHEFKERPGVFQNALKNFESETFQKLKDRDLVPGSDEFETEFDTLRQQWIDKNTRIAIKPSFYAKRSDILKRIKEITSKLNPEQQKDLDFSSHWKVILDVVSGYRDDDGQPIGGEMSDGRKVHVKDAQEAMDAAKAKWASYSGLTREEMDELIMLSANKNAGIPLDKAEWARYKELISVQDELGLDEYDRAELNRLFADLRELQRKEPTPYYLNAVNHWLDVIGSDVLFKRHEITELDATNIDKLMDPLVLDDLFDKSPEFKEWFEKNHIVKKFYNKETGENDTRHERLFVWNVIKPTDPAYYETTEVTKADGTQEIIPGLPKLKFYARVVKKEFRTGYDPATGEVRPVIGIHKDNRGEWLPKPVTDSPYINQEYYDLQKNDPKMFEILQVISKHHLKNQDGIGKRGKLYLDFPRFEKSNLEVIQTQAKQKAKEKMNAFSLMLKRLIDFFKNAKSNTDFNWKQENMLVRADAFNDQIENIPIQGLYNLDEEETSTDIVTSMYQYMFGVEHHKQIVKMNPMAQGLKNILNDPSNFIKEADKVNRSNFINNGVTTYLNKKGKYIRRDAFDNFYQRSFMGETTTGAGKDFIWLQNIQKLVFGRASFAFFAINIPSALKNQIGAKFQAMVESSAGNMINPASLIRGEAWSVKYMTKLSFGDAYAKGHKSLEHQIGEIFDPAQGRFEDKAAKAMTRTLAKDIVETGILYNFRRWTELQATMQTFGAMMYKKKIKMGNTEVDYMDAWELNKEGQIQLKAGISAAYANLPTTFTLAAGESVSDIAGRYSMTEEELLKNLKKTSLKEDQTYTIDNIEFKRFKSKSHAVLNKLNGAYSKFDQPEMQRYLAFRFISYLRRFFTTMALNRFGKKRWNPGYGEIDEGYYVGSAKMLWKILKDRSFIGLNSDDRKNVMKAVTEIGGLYIMGMLTGLLFGWDDDDDDKYKKLRAMSGHLPFPMTEDYKKGQEFDAGGFISLHALNLLMQVRSENEQFVPFPGMGWDNIKTVIDLKSLAFGPTMDAYSDIGNDISLWWKDDNRQYYKRRAGAYDWQQKGSSKIWNHIAKSFGLTAASIDPATGIINFTKVQGRAR